MLCYKFVKRINSDIQLPAEAKAHNRKGDKFIEGQTEGRGRILTHTVAMIVFGISADHVWAIYRQSPRSFWFWHRPKGSWGMGRGDCFHSGQTPLCVGVMHKLCQREIRFARTC